MSNIQQAVNTIEAQAQAQLTQARKIIFLFSYIPTRTYILMFKLISSEIYYCLREKDILRARILES